MALPTRAQRVLRSIRQAIPSGVVLGRRSAGNGPAEFIPLDEITNAQLDAITATHGSVLYRGAAAWTGLPPGTLGDFLQTQGVGADPLWAPAGAGGGFWWFDPPTAAELPTRVTGGTTSGISVVEDTDIGYTLNAVCSTNFAFVAQVDAAPAFPFTVTARFAVNGHGSGGAGLANIDCGIVLRASGTGLKSTFGPTGLDAITIRSTTNVTNNGNVAAANVARWGWYLWLRAVVTNATNIQYEISYDGKNWSIWQANTALGQVAGLDQVGLIVSRTTGIVSPITITCDAWSVA